MKFNLSKVYFSFNLIFRIVQSKRAQLIIKEVDEMVISLNKLETDLIENWKITVSKKCKELSQLPLFNRKSKCNELQLNFHPDVNQMFISTFHQNIFYVNEYYYI